MMFKFNPGVIVTTVAAQTKFDAADIQTCIT